MSIQETVLSEKRRPQEPQPPYPYHQEEVVYENKDAGITLSATLTMPCDNPHPPLMILIPGYGQQDRNLTGMGHKYFLVLSDYLTRSGIAVMRFDKRGVGKSTGDYATATTKDLADDVHAGVEYIRSRTDLTPHRLGLIGLSEGGLIASMVASESKEIDFIVLMAPALLTHTDDLLDMTALQFKADGASQEFIENDRAFRANIYSIVREEDGPQKVESMLKEVIEQYLAQVPENQKREAEKLPFACTEKKADSIIKTFSSPWYRFFLKNDPSVALRNITMPLLAINGDHDWIIAADKIFPLLTKNLNEAGNNNYALIELSQLNHLFQTCTTGALAEYSALEETMSPLAMKTMADWILIHTAC